MFGRTTDADRNKLREEIAEVHELFKSMVVHNRPALDIEAVATGEHWYGTRALELGLVDELGASDDYLLAATRRADVLHVSYHARHRLSEKLLAAVQSALGQVELWIEQRRRERLLP